MKRKMIIVPLVAAILTGVVALGSAQAYAQSSEGQQTIVQRIAQKFGLKESDVQAVFDEERAAHKQVMQQRFVTKLDEAVKAGKLTEAKKQLILKKHAELQAKHEAFFAQRSSISKEEMMKQKQTERAELEAWAKENGIDMTYFFGGMKGGMGKGFMHGR